MVAVLVASACGRSGSSNATATTAGGTGTTVAAAGVGDFGTLKSVCGPGDAKGATDPGVTDTSINMATMSDPGYTAVPGLNQELFDAADAFVGWCNAAGGILGRKIVLHKRDSALTQVAAKMIESCNAPDFMLAGNGEALDATGVQQRLSCKLPEIAGYDVSAAAGTAPLSIDPIPVPNNMSSLGGPWRALAAFDPSVKPKYGLISSNQQSIKDSGNRDKAAAEVVGFTNVSYQEAPPSVDNYRPYVENLHGAGVQVLGIQAQASQDIGYFKSMADVGYFPKYVLLNGNNYDPNMISLGGSLLNSFPGGVLVNSAIVPFELASQVPGEFQRAHQSAQPVRRRGQAQVPRGQRHVGLATVGHGRQGVRVQPDPGLRDATRLHHQGLDGRQGLHSPQNHRNATVPGSQCFTLLKATPSGFVVDKGHHQAQQRHLQLRPGQRLCPPVGLPAVQLELRLPVDRPSAPTSRSGRWCVLAQTAAQSGVKPPPSTKSTCPVM